MSFSWLWAHHGSTGVCCALRRKSNCPDLVCSTLAHRILPWNALLQFLCPVALWTFWAQSWNCYWWVLTASFDCTAVSLHVLICLSGTYWPHHLPFNSRKSFFHPSLAVLPGLSYSCFTSCAKHSMFNNAWNQWCISLTHSFSLRTRKLERFT